MPSAKVEMLTNVAFPSFEAQVRLQTQVTFSHGLIMFGLQWPSCTDGGWSLALTLFCTVLAVFIGGLVLISYRLASVSYKQQAIVGIPIYPDRYSADQPDAGADPVQVHVPPSSSAALRTVATQIMGTS